MAESKFTVVDDSNVYYQGHYWNDYEIVRSHLNKRITNSENTNWHQHFSNTQQGRVFKKALFINCGNGWVERDIYKTGLFEEAVGVDYLQTLIDEGQTKANENDLPFRYYQLDINKGVFPETDFDLVVNHAGCHHIAYLNKVLKAVNENMTDDGYFVNYDYVGPHRNQYSFQQWNSIHQLNKELPENLRQSLSYPHLPTMLSTDPTEAIHSELILEYTYRYFNMVEHKRAGGPLAYPLLTFNSKMQTAQDLEQERWINNIMAKDLTFTEQYPHMSMFDYFVGTPNREIMSDFPRLQTYEEQEKTREDNSGKNKGIYYEFTLLQQLYLEIEELRSSNNHMHSDLLKIYENPLSFLSAKYSKEEISTALRKLNRIF